MEATLNHGGVSFPMHTALLPFPLVQERKGRQYCTSFCVKGKAQLARIGDMKVNPALFPEIDRCRPLLGIRVDPFAITFPPARVAGN